MKTERFFTRWRGVLVCVSVSLVLMLVCSPVSLISKQVRLLAPPNVFQPGQVQAQAVFDHLRKSDRPWAARSAFQAMQWRKAPFQILLQARVNDPDNSLYDFLELLAVMREGRDEEQLIKQMKHAGRADLCRVRVWDQQETLFEGFDRSGYGRMEAAGYVPHLLDRSYRPVLRELFRRLKDEAEKWRRAGRSDAVEVAESCRKRLVEQLLYYQYMPEVALFGARQAREIAHEAGNTARVKKAEAFAAAWHAVSANEERVNILPHTGQYELTNQVMPSFARSVISLYCWVVLALWCLYWAIVAFITRRKGAETYVAPVQWKVMLIRSAMFCVPWLSLMVLVAIFEGSFSWVVSLPTLPAALFLFTWIQPMMHACTRFGSDRHVREIWPKWAGGWLLLGLGGLVLVVFLIWLLMGSSGPVAPPKGVLCFRFLGVWGGIGLLLLSVVWSVAEWRARIRAGWTAGVFARMYLRTGAWCLLLLTILTSGILTTNGIAYFYHERSFKQASQYPIRERVGKDWQQVYFDLPLEGAADKAWMK